MVHSTHVQCTPVQRARHIKYRIEDISFSLNTEIEYEMYFNFYKIDLEQYFNFIPILKKKPLLSMIISNPPKEFKDGLKDIQYRETEFYATSTILIHQRK